MMIWISLNRASSGILTILHYITCIEYWGKTIGIRVMKYYDTVFIVGNFVDCILLTVFKGYQNYKKLILTIFIIDLILLIPSFFFPKTHKQLVMENK